MAAPHGFDDGGTQAYEDHAPDRSVVEDSSAYNAEVPKRRNTRALVAGGMLVVLLILALGMGAVMISRYRARLTEEHALKDKADREKAAMGRRGRQFSGRENDAPERMADLAVPAPLPAASASAIPLKNAPSAPPSQKPTPPAKPPVPSMMVSLPTAGDAGVASAAAADAARKAEPGTDGPKVVQSLANSDAAGKGATATPQTSAAKLGDRSFVIARGSWIPCILETQLNSTIAGATSCVIPEDVYSDDGKALLVGKGSHAQGQFGGTLKTGDQRIAVTWARIKTTQGLVIDVDSPAADGVGTTGAGGYIDNHWLDRIGAAVLLSFIEDGLAFAVAREQNTDNASNSSGLNSSMDVYMPTNSVNSTKRLSEKILDSTINIPPTLYKNRGDRVMIFVNRDLWFDSTYSMVKG